MDASENEFTEESFEDGHEDWVEDILLRVDELRYLEKDWDSYGALPISITAMHAAKKAAIAIFSGQERPTSWHVVPISNGGVQVEAVLCDGSFLEFSISHETAEESGSAN